MRAALRLSAALCHSAFARRVLAASLLLLVAAPLRVTAEAQGNRRTVLTLTGSPLTVSETTVADYQLGYVDIVGSWTYAIWLRTNTGAGGFSPRVTTVNVACLAPCPASGTSANRLLFRRANSGVWNPLTTAYTLLETRTVAFVNGAPNPTWSNDVFWRYSLDWATTPPAAATQYIISFQLVVTAP